MTLTIRRFAVAVLSVVMVTGAMSTVVVGAATPRTSTRSALLRASDLGIGWTVHHTRASLGIGCLRAVVGGAARQGVTSSKVTFVDHANPPEVTDVVAHFTTSASVQETFNHVVAALRACHRVHGYFSGHFLRGTVHTLRTPLLGSASAAFAATARVSGAILVEDLVVMRSGHVVVALAEGNVGAVDPSQFVGFAERALERAHSLAARR